MFKAIGCFFVWTGNFGLAILIVTIIIKILFLPLANKSYASMAKMKAVQSEGDPRAEDSLVYRVILTANRFTLAGLPSLATTR